MNPESATDETDYIDALERMVGDLEERVAIAVSRQSWGYTRRGNAYSKPPLIKDRAEPIDIATDEAPHG